MKTPLSRNQWYPILQARTLKANKPCGIKRLNIDLVLWRDDKGDVHCLEDRCCHRRAKLSPGKIINGNIECFYHGFQYDSSGKLVRIPANGQGCRISEKFCVKKFTVCEQKDLIWLWFGDQDPGVFQWFDDPEAESGIYVESSSNFPVNYLRIIENFHDAHHVPVTHKSFTPGLGTKVYDYSCNKTGQITKIRCAIGPDDSGGRAVKKVPFVFDILFPTTLLLKLNKKMHLVGVATPIDDETTWFFGRYYQRYLPLPVVGHFLAWLLLFFDWYLLQKFQDLPRWQSQKPKEHGSLEGYHLIEADAGIVLYYKELAARSKPEG